MKDQDQGNLGWLSLQDGPDSAIEFDWEIEAFTAWKKPSSWQRAKANVNMMNDAFHGCVRFFSLAPPTNQHLMLPTDRSHWYQDTSHGTMRPKRPPCLWRVPQIEMEFEEVIDPYPMRRKHPEFLFLGRAFKKCLKNPKMAWSNWSLGRQIAKPSWSLGGKMARMHLSSVSEEVG